MKRCEMYRREREKGLTYQEIADKYGVSRQAVQQVCSKYTLHFFRPFTKEQCIYINLRNWLNDNKISKAELLRRLDIETIGVNNNRVSDYLKGRMFPQKRVIDKFITATGLTYEELFVVG